ncbi:MAG TPA: TolC family protein [Vicinamibacterales bacterium]|nr:TolC family protein [Vicinamibacterales bacterium]
MSKTARTLAAAGFVLAWTLPALGQQKTPEPSKAHVQALIAQAMQQTGQTPAPTGSQLTVPGGPLVNLTEEEAVARARDKNLTLISERITPQTFDFSIAATRAAYALNLTSSTGLVNNTQLSTNLIQGGGQIKTETQSWSSGLSKRMWRGGGQYNVNWTSGRDTTTSTNTTCSPCFTSGVNASFTQPLWRNFRIDNTRAQIRTNEISQEIAEINLSGQEVSILAQVRNAYWELVYARQAVEAAQTSLDLASKLVQDNRARVEIGTMAPIDVVQAQAEEANRRQQLVTAQATLRNNELALKRLLVSGTDDELWRATIVPVDRPRVTAQAIDLEAAVTTALSRRTDLAVTKKNLESSDIALETIENETKPQLDFVGGLNLTGRAGQGRERPDPFNPGSVIPAPTGSYFDALRQMSTFEAPRWDFRMNFSYPLGTSAAKANLSRQRLLRSQTEASLKAAELQVATEVTAAALAVRNSLEAMQAATATRELSEQRLNAAQSKFEVGMATNFEVVQAQRDLNDARNNELRQQLNYQRALVDFQRVQLTAR